MEGFIRTLVDIGTQHPVGSAAATTVLLAVLAYIGTLFRTRKEGRSPSTVSEGVLGHPAKFMQTVEVLLMSFLAVFATAAIIVHADLAWWGWLLAAVVVVLAIMGSFVVLWNLWRGKPKPKPE